ncbi:type II toxin-antitoxin system RelE family toxin [Candidatus Palauibacter sp.]|uniref:type II toxin-antitoxin system RelE family toxin n=1 Tax=Candidatus Palauibacter sp. TaxID=3101350 RepID=UPI003B02CC47
MARYDVEISRTAERQLRKLPRADQERVARRMSALADDPLPKGTRKLTGYDDVFRVRAGRYRILYSVAEATLVIIVLKVGHRRDVYRRS